MRIESDPLNDQAQQGMDLLPLRRMAAASENTQDSLRDEWRASFATAALTQSGLATVQLPPRGLIVGEWCREGDLGFIFAPRGVGKTWLAMHLAASIAEGRSVAAWDVPKARTVLYVDGEMPFDGLKQRLNALSKGESKLLLLQHEQLFHTTGKVLNLTSAVVQEALTCYCEANGVEVMILDNLSCLFSGVKENDADAWELVLPWLLDLRRKRIAVVIVHHAGRNGAMRGTSRREDAAFWVIQLTEARLDGPPGPGARFIARFTKNRNTTDEAAQPWEWHFTKRDDGSIGVSFKLASNEQVFRQLIEDGFTGATEIASEMGISKGQVSKIAKKGILAGWLQKVGQEYQLVTL